MRFDNITDVPGVKVGNKEDLRALTGCTVILTEKGAIGGVDVRGGAPGTRETDMLNPINTTEVVHGICLAGGSCFGLDSASGVMKYLEEKGFGLALGVVKVPIVPAAILFDLQIGNPYIRPDNEMGYKAASVAQKGIFPQGNIGAGCGATVGKLAGMEYCMKGGLGSASLDLGDGLVIGAIVAVNAVGDVRNPNTGEILAGPRDKITGIPTDSLKYLQDQYISSIQPGTNTTIGVIAVNATMNKSEATKVAQMAQNGLARTIVPAHSRLDGDTVFTIATGGKRVSIDYLGAMAVKVMEQAITKAIITAQGVNDIPAYSDLRE